MFGLPPVADAVFGGILLAVIALVAVIVLVRMIGLRSFSKMTAFDFVITLATGSLLAAAATTADWPAFIKAVVAIITLMGIQVALAFGRRKSERVTALVDNNPLLLMRDGAFIDAAMEESRVSPGDVYAKLRGANVLSLSEVRAVVLETTGDISVIHGESLAPELLAHVRGAEPVAGEPSAHSISATRKP